MGTQNSDKMHLFLSGRSSLQVLRLRFRELWRPASSNRTYSSHATPPSSAVLRRLPTCQTLHPCENLPVLPVPTPKLTSLCFLPSTGVVVPVQFQSSRIPVQSRCESCTFLQVQFRFGTIRSRTRFLSGPPGPVPVQSRCESCTFLQVQFRFGTIRSRTRFLSGPPGPVPVQSRCYLHLLSSPVPAWNPFRILKSSSGLEQSVPGFLTLPCVIFVLAFPVQFWDYPKT
ncbi:hypothetical protein SKAU_G00082210 [Synaphobranchus kaupii]|uniref:Uncharacterized protein n=1 Tax=Synaphobranchus kaupii TaxID=118154 RepID=A0A9Q1J5P6_SYNKA|nr:hypothetical protein SKAU_G00082210 [Synaphobranchus kaupii]